MGDHGGFCLRWNNHQSTLVAVLEKLLEDEKLVDVTLAADGEFIRAHRVVLCACSAYFEELLSHQSEKHAIFFMKGVPISQLRALLSYMYHGEANVAQDELSSFVQLGYSLRVKGLTDNNAAQSLGNNANSKLVVKQAAALLSNPTSPALPRRKKQRRRSTESASHSIPNPSPVAPRCPLLDTPTTNVRSAAKVPEPKRLSILGTPMVTVPVANLPEIASATQEIKLTKKQDTIPKAEVSEIVVVSPDDTSVPTETKSKSVDQVFKREQSRTIEVEELSLEDNGEDDWSDGDGCGQGSGQDNDAGENTQSNGGQSDTSATQGSASLVAELLQCERCALIFKQRDWRQFAVHRRYCGLTFRFNCPYCDYGTNTNSNFHRHMRTLHKDLYNT